MPDQPRGPDGRYTGKPRPPAEQYPRATAAVQALAAAVATTTTATTTTAAPAAGDGRVGAP
jgi:hypothetical protein